MQVFGNKISKDQIAAITGAIAEPFHLGDLIKAAELAGVPKGLIAREAARKIATSKLSGGLRKIIENTESAQNDFTAEADALWTGGCSSSTIILSDRDLAALQQGRCVAFDDGEFSTFIVLGNAGLKPGSNMATRREPPTAPSRSRDLVKPAEAPTRTGEIA